MWGLVGVKGVGVLLGDWMWGLVGVNGVGVCIRDLDVGFSGC